MRWSEGGGAAKAGGAEKTPRAGVGRRVAPLALAAAVALWARGSQATEPRKVFSPIVEEGEAELETVGTVERDRNPARNGGQAYTFEAGYGVTSFWFAEFEGEFKSDPGDRLRHEASAWENVLQVTPQGAYWLDLGLFAEFEIAARRGDADEAIFGPILQKELGDWLATANLFLDKEVGANAGGGAGLEYAAQLRYRWRRWLEPGIEAYGEPGELARFLPGEQQTHQLGPVITGHLRLDGVPGRLKYELGYLFGLTAGTAQGAVKWRLEYEFVF
jgi:hypothetical protein